MRQAAIKAGLRQGFIEFRQSFSGTELIGQLFWPVVTLIAMFWFRNRTFGASGFQLGALMFPGVLGMLVSFGMMLVVQFLAMSREDGTLLRAKSTPGGLTGFFIGKLVTTSMTVLVYLAVVLLPGLVMFPDLHISWFTLTWVLLLGMIATQSIGGVLGGLVSSLQGAAYLSFPIMGLIGISGIFYPLTALPTWVQWVAQVFPVYWLGLGMRSAMLPHAAAALEIAHSRRPLESAVVLGLWALAGLLFAPGLLARMAQRESGSALEQRQQQARQLGQ